MDVGKVLFLVVISILLLGLQVVEIDLEEVWVWVDCMLESG